MKNNVGHADELHRHLLNKINGINQRFANKVISLELQVTLLGGNADVAQATDAFARSIKEIASWDWSNARSYWNTATP